MENPIEFHRCDGGSLKERKEHTPKRVSNRDAEPSFKKGLGSEAWGQA
jgi:hypothetical protein